MTLSRQMRHKAGRYPRVNAEKAQRPPVKLDAGMRPPVTPQEDEAMDDLAVRRALRAKRP